MVMLRLPALLLGLLLLLPAAAQARLTLGWVKGAPILGSEEQARRLAAHLEARLAEPVVLRACADEAQLHEWLHRYRMVDLAPMSQDYFQRLPAGQLLPLADLQAGAAAARMVLRQGLRSDQQLQLRTVLANLPEEPAGRDLLAGLNGLRLSLPAAAPRASFAAAVPAPVPAAAAPVVWPDEAVAARPLAPVAELEQAEPPSLPALDEPVKSPAPLAPLPAALPEVAAPSPPAAIPDADQLLQPQAPPVLALPPATPLPAVVAPLPEPPATIEPAPPVVVEAPAALPVVVEPPVAPAVPEPVKVVEKTAPLALPAAQSPVADPPAAAVVAEPVKVVEKVVPPVVPAAPPVKPVVEAPPPTPQSLPKLAALPAKPAVAAPAEVKPKLPEEAVSRSLSSGRQPLGEGKGLQTIYLVPFTTIMVPLPVAEAVFDQFVETLNETGPADGFEFVILKDDLDRVDPTWLRKATYVTGEIFGYVEESGCCSTDIRSKSRLALYRPGASEPKLRHEYPAKAFFDHDYSTLDAERKKLAERISQDLSSQLIKALGGG